MAERDLSISKKKRIGSILLRSELAAGELAVNWQPTSARYLQPGYVWSCKPHFSYIFGYIKYPVYRKVLLPYNVENCRPKEQMLCKCLPRQYRPVAFLKTQTTPSSGTSLYKDTEFNCRKASLYLFTSHWTTKEHTCLMPRSLQQWSIS